VIFLLNKDRVFVGAVARARCRLALWLKLPDEAVTARIELSKYGTPMPVFQVDREQCAVGPRVIEDSIRAAYERLLLELKVEMKYLDTRWGDA